MSTESNRPSSQPSPTPPENTELKASDFFPPGEGWNREDESKDAARPGSPTSAQPPLRDQH